MPLHAEGEARRTSATRTASIVPSDATASTTSPGARPIDRLLMQGIYHDPSVPSSAASRPDSATLWLGTVAFSPARRGRRDGPSAPATPAPLVQRAAKRHVQLLDAAADRQHRHPRAQAPRRISGRVRGVARRVVQLGRQAVAAAIEVGMHIARAAGQQQAVQTVEHRTLRLPQRRNHQRQNGGGAEQAPRHSEPACRGATCRSPAWHRRECQRSGGAWRGRVSGRMVREESKIGGPRPPGLGLLPELCSRRDPVRNRRPDAVQPAALTTISGRGPLGGPAPPACRTDRGSRFMVSGAIALRNPLPFAKLIGANNPLD